MIDGEVARRALSFATVEAVALAVLRDHYKGPGWVWGGGWRRDRPGRWSCSCGAGGELGQGDRITDFHRRHVAQVLAHGITGTGNDHE